jgi:hypothetical protein
MAEDTDTTAEEDQKEEGEEEEVYVAVTREDK